ncbi:ArsR family transcriptional regulator [Patescibacteria group bacterium]|nr:MAG: ArsR family transcriptional regulator [Patescibacteria group bacterium]
MCYNKMMKRWTVVFKILGNINRLKIIDLLSDGQKMNVGDIAAALKISLTATSNHLVMLQKLDVLEVEGRAGHVFYYLNRKMPRDFSRALTLFTH